MMNFLPGGTRSNDCTRHPTSSASQADDNRQRHPEQSRGQLLLGSHTVGSSLGPAFIRVAQHQLDSQIHNVASLSAVHSQPSCPYPEDPGDSHGAVRNKGMNQGSSSLPTQDQQPSASEPFAFSGSADHLLASAAGVENRIHHAGHAPSRNYHARGVSAPSATPSSIHPLHTVGDPFHQLQQQQHQLQLLEQTNMALQQQQQALFSPSQQSFPSMQPPMTLQDIQQFQLDLQQELLHQQHHQRQHHQQQQQQRQQQHQIASTILWSAEQARGGIDVSQQQLGAVQGMNFHQQQHPQPLLLHSLGANSELGSQQSWSRAGITDPGFENTLPPGTGMSNPAAASAGGDGNVNHMLNLMAQRAPAPGASHFNYGHSAGGDQPFLGKFGGGGVTMGSFAPLAGNVPTGAPASLDGINTAGGIPFSSAAAATAMGMPPFLPDTSFPSSFRDSMIPSEVRTTMGSLEFPSPFGNLDVPPASLPFGDSTSNVAQRAASFASTMVPAYGKTPSATPPVLKPLSAYNYFFAEERDRILTGTEKNDDETDDQRQRRLLSSHLEKDRNKRRPHRKTHGKISFTTLSKRIGQKWRELDVNEKDFYKQVAKADLSRYKREMAERGNVE
jgi:HMG (high mobility group) box